MEKTLNLNALVLDARLQSRVEISDEAVAQYATDMERGDVFPPIVVFFDSVNYYVTDGFHRYHAAKRAGKAGFQCDIRHGTFRDAHLYALTQANRQQGMRKTLQDRKKSCAEMLEDIEWSQWNNSRIGEQVGLSAHTVKEMREAMGKTQDKVKYTTPSGEVKQRTSKNTKRKPKAKTEAKPEIEDAAKELIDTLQTENATLTDRLAVAALDATDEEKKLAEQTMAELRERVRILEIELEAVKRSRDTYQNENGAMKKHIAVLTKKLKQLENA